jgi:hypothetical protein
VSDADQFGIVFDRKRPADQIALHLVAAFLREKREQRFGLHPFSDHRQIEAASKPDHRAHDELDVAYPFFVRLLGEQLEAIC